ncbi:hypothetical protein DAI22_12g095650 [Oryza sativa Japonica Group]|uniref:Secreted protein n=2 Tax=Oryza TaxID=4527 RepID=Q2QTX0_ORYSJ|nr:hypothetical protein LOC_Os12g18240 [Oryza sativa Japonica Group]KAF2907410.1 hypothetical protein DAI22_12g095650 [Oryza sativa Japonica Group]
MAPTDGFAQPLRLQPAGFRACGRLCLLLLATRQLATALQLEASSSCDLRRRRLLQPPPVASDSSHPKHPQPYPHLTCVSVKCGKWATGLGHYYRIGTTC